jgi:hypothetical protein
MFKSDEGFVVLADSNGMGSCVRAQDAFPLVYLLLINIVDTVDDIGTRENSHRRIGFFENLQPQKVIGMLMSDVDNRQRFLGGFEVLQYLFGIGLGQLRVNQHHLMGALNDGGVGPKLIVGGRNDLKCEVLPVFRKRRLRETQYDTAKKK